MIARSEQFETSVVTAAVIPRQGATPYVRMGNRPVLIMSLLLMLLPLVSGRWRRSGA
jgi:apolipoprotein N-acyltransferase